MASAEPDWSWNPFTDLRQIWSYPFMVDAFWAGTVVAVLAGAPGWFMVLRRQSFTGHMLALVGFPGAAGATLLGVRAVRVLRVLPDRGGGHECGPARGPVRRRGGVRADRHRAGVPAGVRLPAAAAEATQAVGALLLLGLLAAPAGAAQRLTSRPD